MEITSRAAKVGVLVAAICMAGVSDAATKELTRAIFDAIAWDNNTPNAEQRKKFALAIEAYWVEFDKRVPRLSPKEREWIEGEFSTQGDRLNRALESVEYSIWSLNERTDQCLGTIRSVISTFGNEETKQLEMYYWVKMVNCYDGTGDLNYYLKKAGIPESSEDGKGVQAPLSNIVQGIIVNKAAPMAMAETMHWTYGP